MLPANARKESAARQARWLAEGEAKASQRMAGPGAAGHEHRPEHVGELQLYACNGQGRWLRIYYCQACKAVEFNLWPA